MASEAPPGGCPPWASPAPAGLLVSLRVTPKASRNAVQGVAVDAAGKPALQVRVTAPPEDGKANAAVVKLLAAEWRIAKSRLSIVAGAADRRKTVCIEGDPAEVAVRLDAWARTHRLC